MVANRERLQKRMWRLAVVVAVQNVLVTVCLTVTLYVFWDVQSRTAGSEETTRDNVHIQLNTVSDISGNVTVQFSQVYSSNMMSLSEQRKDQIHVNCTGPYVLHMFVCYKDINETGARGSLRLLVVGRETPVSDFNLQASHEVCGGVQSVAYLRDKERISLHLVSSTRNFKIKNVTVGLSYLLGRCEYL